MTLSMTLFTVHLSSYATAYGGDSCESIIPPTLAFLLPTSNPCQARSTTELSPPQESLPRSVCLIEGDVTRQLDCAADRVPEFWSHFCSVVHELAS